MKLYKKTTMASLFILLTLVLPHFSSGLPSDFLDHGGFEDPINWYGDGYDDWFGSGNVILDGTTVHSGNYAVKLQIGFDIEQFVSYPVNEFQYVKFYAAEDGQARLRVTISYLDNQGVERSKGKNFYLSSSYKAYYFYDSNLPSDAVTITNIQFMHDANYYYAISFLVLDSIVMYYDTGQCSGPFC